MGEDGHIASLFPGHKYPENRSVIIEKKSPKIPRQRLSMSYKQLNKSTYVFKIILGQPKRQAISLIFQGCDLPINRVFGEVEKIFIHSSAIPVGGEQ
jgi:6-phosphogluconolactonase